MTEYTLGEIPPEPAEKTALADRNGVVWQRAANHWASPSVFIGKTWTQLLVENGPLCELVPADDRNDTLRADLIELLGDRVGWSDPSDDEILVAVERHVRRHGYYPVRPNWPPAWRVTHPDLD